MWQHGTGIQKLSKSWPMLCVKFKLELEIKALKQILIGVFFDKIFNSDQNMYVYQISK